VRARTYPCAPGIARSLAGESFERVTCAFRSCTNPPMPASISTAPERDMRARRASPGPAQIPRANRPPPAPGIRAAPRRRAAPRALPAHAHAIARCIARTPAHTRPHMCARSPSRFTTRALGLWSTYARAYVQLNTRARGQKIFFFFFFGPFCPEFYEFLVRLNRPKLGMPCSAEMLFAVNLLL
jgi:hypothetical protein